DGPSVQAAPGLFGAGPAALAPGPRLRARRAADRLVAPIVQQVVGQVALVDAPPQVLVGPVGERVVLPDPARAIAFDRLRLGAGGPLLAADAGDPSVGSLQRALQGGHLRRRAAVVGPAPGHRGAGRVLHLDLHAEALLEL